MVELVTENPAYRKEFGDSVGSGSGGNAYAETDLEPSGSKIALDRSPISHSNILEMKSTTRHEAEPHGRSKAGETERVERQSPIHFDLHEGEHSSQFSVLIKVLEKFARWFDKRVSGLERNIRELRSELATRKGSDKSLDTVSSSARSAFRINIYARQGGYRGTIEHILTKEKRPFSGMDREAILDFMSSHLPSETPNGAEQLVREEPRLLPASGTPPVPRRSIPVKEFLIAGKKGSESSTVLSRDQSFRVHVSVGEDELLEGGKGIAFCALLYGRLIGSGTKGLVAESHGELPPSHEMMIEVPAQKLAVGPYRFTVYVHFLRSDGHPLPIVAFQEGSLTLVVDGRR